MTQIRAEIRALSKSHPIPQQEKLDRRMLRLERMARFYDDKAPEAPTKQGLMFRGFVSALIYAITIIKMYRKLTKKLAEIAEETDEHRAN